MYDDLVKMALWKATSIRLKNQSLQIARTVSIKSCHKKCYNARAGSVIKESDTETTTRRKIQATESFETLMFSSESVNEFKRLNFCKNCKRNAVPLGMFVTCNDYAS